jgi:hypothetical protein
MPSKRNPTAQLIADNIATLHSSQGQLKLTWLMSEQQEPVRYAIGEGILDLLSKHGVMNGVPTPVIELLDRWESTPALRRGAAAKELREALGL